MEYYLSCLKVLTIVLIGQCVPQVFSRCTLMFEFSLVLLGLLIDLGASRQGCVILSPFRCRSSQLFVIPRTIGFRNWKNQPFAENYLGIEGAKGRFLGFYAVIMQAAFSFFGSEVPGIVGRSNSLLPSLISSDVHRQLERS